MTMLRGLLLPLLALLLAAAPAAAQGAITVQFPTEPPGLDLTTNPSSTIAGVDSSSSGEAQAAKPTKTAVASTITGCIRGDIETSVG